ncbi:bromodomain-containing protein, partial [Tanacetum coccineum]
MVVVVATPAAAMAATATAVKNVAKLKTGSGADTDTVRPQVDKCMMELPDYHELIKLPMNFGTVRRKLDGGRRDVKRHVVTENTHNNVVEPNIGRQTSTTESVDRRSTDIEFHNDTSTAIRIGHVPSIHAICQEENLIDCDMVKNALSTRKVSQALRQQRSVDT